MKQETKETWNTAKPTGEYWKHRKCYKQDYLCAEINDITDKIKMNQSRNSQCRNESPGTRSHLLTLHEWEHSYVATSEADLFNYMLQKTEH